MILHIWVKNMNKSANSLKQIVKMMLIIITIFVGIYFNIGEEKQTENVVKSNKISYETSNIPEYSGEIYVEINNNIPGFTVEDINLEYDYYSELENGRVRGGNDKN